MLILYIAGFILAIHCLRYLFHLKWSSGDTVLSEAIQFSFTWIKQFVQQA